MLWRAKGLDYIWVPIEFGSFNNLFLLFSHELQNALSGQKPNIHNFWLKAYFFLKSLKHYFFYYHCGAVALAINLIFWSGTRLSKRQYF